MIVQMLELSTAHLSLQTVGLFEMQTDDIPVFYDKLEGGWFMPVLPDALNPHTMPADLKACLDLARSKNCTWLMFDRDAEALEELPTYDW